MIMGVDPNRNELFQDYELKQGESFSAKENEEDVAMMEVGFANALGVKVGDEIKLTTIRQRDGENL